MPKPKSTPFCQSASSPGSSETTSDPSLGAMPALDPVPGFYVPKKHPPILLPMPPDYSCEIEKPLRYVDYIADIIDDRAQLVKDAQDTGHITLSVDEAETFVWMLRDACTVIHQMNKEFYGDDGWDRVWWKNRAMLECSGIEIPWWFQIENSRKAAQEGQ